MGLKGCRQDQKFRELTLLCRAPRVPIFRRARFRPRPSGRPIGCGFIGFTRKSIGLTSSAISAAYCAKVAPSRIAWLHPRERGSGEPGTAITSPPASAPPYCPSAFAFADAGLGSLNQILNIYAMLPENDQRTRNKHRYQVISFEIDGRQRRNQCRKQASDR